MRYWIFVYGGTGLPIVFGWFETVLDAYQNLEDLAVKLERSGVRVVDSEVPYPFVAVVIKARLSDIVYPVLYAKDYCLIPVADMATATEQMNVW